MSAPIFGEDWKGRLRSLKSGWDSYGGHPITDAAIDTVERFAVVPCSNGGVQIEIHKDGFDIEIVIEPDGVIRDVAVGRLD